MWASTVDVLKMLHVLHLLHVLNMPMDASLACWALCTPYLEESLVKVEGKKRLGEISEELLDDGSDVTRLRVRKIHVAALDATLSGTATLRHLIGRAVGMGETEFEDREMIQDDSR